MDDDGAARVAEQATSQRETNQAMVARLRAQQLEPYRTHRPVPRVIAVVGRRSGVVRPFPVNVTLIDGHLYVCSATRERDWVRNLLEAGFCRIERDGPADADTERYPVSVEQDEAARALAIYLPRCGFRDPMLPFELDAPIEEIARHVHQTAVLRLDG